MTIAHPLLPGQLGPVPKQYRRGTHRFRPPAETVMRTRPFMPVMGITRIANITGLDSVGVPVVMVCRPNSRSLAVSQGKGLDLDAARASGLMESVESYHAEHITSPLKLGSYEELRYTHRLADIFQLPRPAHGLLSRHEAMLWVEGYDLLGEASVWVPYDVVHTNFTAGPWNENRRFLSSSNGLASGNHLLEAVDHAMAEVVERDAHTLWTMRSREEQEGSRLALHTVADPDCRTVLDRFEAAGLSTAVWEITSDTGVPAYRCTITERDDGALHQLYSATGMGCHPTRSIAFLRAMLEAAQSRVTAIAGSRDDMWRIEYERFGDPEAVAASRRMIDAAGTRPFAGPEADGDTFDEDVRWQLDRLAAVGITQVIAVDLTKAEFGIPVVRVVIPGLESSNWHGDYRYGRRAQRVLEQRR